MTRRRLLDAAWACPCLSLAALWPGVALAQAGADERSPAVDAPGAAPLEVSNADGAGLDAEADAVIASLTDDTASLAAADVEEFKLNIYGFADFTYTHRLNDFAYVSPYPTFMVGNLNLYVGAELGGGWRTLTEFRLLYAPNGTIPSDQLELLEPTRTETSVADPADFGRPLRWGGVEIERAWLEYSAHPLLTIRGGQWLSPYGIWIVDHGSPVIIGVRRPYVVGEALIPERQTGLQIYGSQLVGRTELGYALSLSNGRGPSDAFADLDKNKAFTGRVYANAELPVGGTVSLGYTLYRGNYTDRATRYVSSPTTGETGIEYFSTDRYEELAMAADLRWVWEGLTVQGELIMREVALDDRFRPLTFASPGIPAGYQADHRSIGFYAMAAYRLPWLNITPFFGGEKYEPKVTTVFEATAIWGGINVRPTPRVVLKAQFTQSWLTGETPVFGDDGLQALDLQAAWSF